MLNSSVSPYKTSKYYLISFRIHMLFFGIISTDCNWNRLTKAIKDMRNDRKSVESFASLQATSTRERIKLLTALGDRATL
nr:hypothetical protein Iba_chr12aCG15500 [Ipomoea batatas]GMD70862.1 hypothetical protein Iba_chr12eCG10430 [Ipomoea batatas]GME13171.1 hypothetical protein Iba_scaffold14366CG0010 [Ipomoea batatas]